MVSWHNAPKNVPIDPISILRNCSGTSNGGNGGVKNPCVKHKQDSTTQLENGRHKRDLIRCQEEEFNASHDKFQSVQTKGEKLKTIRQKTPINLID
jgi:hypothetical protein